MTRVKLTIGRLSLIGIYWYHLTNTFINSNLFIWILSLVWPYISYDRTILIRMYKQIRKLYLKLHQKKITSKLIKEEKEDVLLFLSFFYSVNLNILKLWECINKSEKRRWIPNPGVLCSKPLGGSKVDSAFHASKVDKMSTRNFWELNGKK